MAKRTYWLDDVDLKLLASVEMENGDPQSIHECWGNGNNLVYDPITDTVFTCGRVDSLSAVEVADMTLDQYKEGEL